MTNIANEQKTLMETRSKTRELTGMAMMAALSVVVLLVVPKFPIFPAAPYLVYDMADVPIIMSTFMFGPLPGFLVLVIASLIQALTLSADGLIGGLMHIISSGTLILVSYYVANLFSKKVGVTKGMIIGLLAGSIGMTLMMIPLNLIITVHVYGTPQDVVMAALVPAIIPFNFLKAAINSAIFFICYKLICISKPNIFKFGKKTDMQK